MKKSSNTLKLIIEFFAMFFILSSFAYSDTIIYQDLFNDGIFNDSIWEKITPANVIESSNNLSILGSGAPYAGFRLNNSLLFNVSNREIIVILNAYFKTDIGGSFYPIFSTWDAAYIGQENYALYGDGRFYNENIEFVNIGSPPTEVLNQVILKVNNSNFCVKTTYGLYNITPYCVAKTKNYNVTFPLVQAITGTTAVENITICDDTNNNWICEVPVPPSDKPSITQVFPNSTYNDTYNIDMRINVSLNITGNCSINNTAFSVYFSNTTFYSWNETSLTDGFYSVYVNCTHDLMSNITVYFRKDKTVPYISSIIPINLNLDMGDLSSYYRTVNDDWGFNLTLTDNNDLYRFDWNLTNSTSSIYNNSQNLSGLNYDIAISYNGFLSFEKNYSIIYRLCDSHTSNFIAEADIIDSKNKLNLTFGELSISLKPEYANTVFYAEKLSDRYIFSTNGRIGTKNIFTLESNYPIHYLMHSKYKGHFVIGDYWIDFEPYDVIVYPIKNYYKIEVKSPDIDLNFNSIGTLNCINNSFIIDAYFPPTPSNATYIYNATALIGHTNWFNLDKFDTSTTSGVLLFFFSFIIIVAMVTLSEYTQIPIFAAFTGILTIFIGILYYTSISAIIGLFVIIMAISYIIRGIAMAT